MTRQKKKPALSPQVKKPVEDENDPGTASTSGTPLINFSPSFFRHPLLLIGAPLVVLAVGLALRLYHLGEFSVWIDEANTVRIARMGFADMIGALSLDSSPPLYYLLLRFWMFLFGEGPFAIRLLSVLFSVALIGYVFIVGHRFFSYQTGLIASILMAVAPAQILHAQQCRMYTLLPLFALGAFHCLKNASETGSRVWLAGWIACMIGAVYTHNYGWFLFPACLWILWFSGELRQRPLHWIGATALVGVVYLPWSPIFWQQLHIGAQNSWYEPIWNALGPHGNFFSTLDSFSGGRKSLSFTWAKSDPLIIPRLLIFIAVSAWALYTPFRKDNDSGAGNHTWDILAFWIIPLITTIIVSLVLSPVYRYGRSDQLVFPAFLILTAAGVTAFRKPAVVSIITALLTILALANYPPLTAHASMRGDANMADKILKLAQPGDVILSTSLTVGPLEYYARQANLNLPIITFPRDDANHPAIRDKAAWLVKPGGLATEAAGSLNDVCKAAGAGGRFFTVLTIDEFNQPLIDLLRRQYTDNALTLPGKYQITITNRPTQLLIMTCP